LASIKRLILVFAGLFVALALSGNGFLPAMAQEKPACEQFDWSIKREQALFGAPDLKAAASGTKLSAPLDSGAALQLLPNAAVSFVLTPARQPKAPDSFGGVITADVPKAGSYQVTLSAEAWIDVIQDGKSLDSTAHTGKRGCADIRKSVRFDLKPGIAAIQISGAPANAIKLAVLPAE
jgi:hypothetical protein